MPYTKQDARGITCKRDASGKVIAIYPDHILDGADLNYAISELLSAYYYHHKARGYCAFEQIVGACMGALAEFRRRIIHPYEEEKIKENGDLFYYAKMDLLNDKSEVK